MLVQRHIPRLRRRCEFDIFITTVCRRCHYNIHNILRGKFIIQHRDNIDATLGVDVVVSTL